MTLIDETREHQFDQIGTLADEVAPFSASLFVPEVAKAFLTDSRLDSVAIVSGATPVGLMTRQKLFSRVFRPFGWELFKRSPISDLIEGQTLQLRDHVPVDSALTLALARADEEVYDDIIVVDQENRYRGILSVRRMVLEQSDALAEVLAQRNLANARAVEMERIAELKSEFLANVTHELRSPVNAIIELSELMTIAWERGSIDDFRARLDLLQKTATNLRRVITNMLDLSKIEAGKMDVIPERFDLIPLLHEVAETARLLVARKPIAVEVVTAEKHCPAYTDAVKVRQILTNLVSNAAKFTEQGRIAIRHSSEGDFISLDVCDTGPGIAKSDLDRLFVAFSQLESTKTKRHDGTGLGLTITRELAQLLGGSVSVRSAWGEGSTFSVQLPRRFDDVQREIA